MCSKLKEKEGVNNGNVFMCGNSCVFEVSVGKYLCFEKHRPHCELTNIAKFSPVCAYSHQMGMEGKTDKPEFSGVLC